MKSTMLQLELLGRIAVQHGLLENEYIKQTFERLVAMVDTPDFQKEFSSLKCYILTHRNNAEMPVGDIIAHVQSQSSSSTNWMSGVGGGSGNESSGDCGGNTSPNSRSSDLAISNNTEEATFRFRIRSSNGHDTCTSQSATSSGGSVGTASNLSPADAEDAVTDDIVSDSESDSNGGDLTSLGWLQNTSVEFCPINDIMDAPPQQTSTQSRELDDINNPDGTVGLSLKLLKHSPVLESLIGRSRPTVNTSPLGNNCSANQSVHSQQKQGKEEDVLKSLASSPDKMIEATILYPDVHKSTIPTSSVGSTVIKIPTSMIPLSQSCSLSAVPSTPPRTPSKAGKKTHTRRKSYDGCSIANNGTPRSLSRSNSFSGNYSGSHNGSFVEKQFIDILHHQKSHTKNSTTSPSRGRTIQRSQSCNQQSSLRENPYTYGILIGMALQAAPENRLLFEDVVNWFHINYPSWDGDRNALYQHLSLSKYFRKRGSGSGSSKNDAVEWIITKKYARELNSKITIAHQAAGVSIIRPLKALSTYKRPRSRTTGSIDVKMLQNKDTFPPLELDTLLETVHDALRESDVSTDNILFNNNEADLKFPVNDPSALMNELGLTDLNHPKFDCGNSHIEVRDWRLDPRAATCSSLIDEENELFTGPRCDSAPPIIHFDDDALLSSQFFAGLDLTNLVGDNMVQDRNVCNNGDTSNILNAPFSNWEPTELLF